MYDDVLEGCCCNHTKKRANVEKYLEVLQGWLGWFFASI